MKFLLLILFLWNEPDLTKNISIFVAKNISVMKHATDLTGQKFGRLIVIERRGSKEKPSGQKVHLWLCKCDCGNEKIIPGYAIRWAQSQSCGCYNLENVKQMHVTHGKCVNRQMTKEY